MSLSSLYAHLLKVHNIEWRTWLADNLPASVDSTFPSSSCTFPLLSVCFSLPPLFASFADPVLFLLNRRPAVRCNVFPEWNDRGYPSMIELDVIGLTEEERHPVA
jgi:hypothetical protein